MPIGTKTSVIFEGDNFKEVSRLLKYTKLISSDFENLINKAEYGDLIFADPPYTVRHNYNGFVKYNEKIFSWHDQERLFHSLNEASQRGVIIVSTNAYHESVRELYQGTFHTRSVSRNSSISSKVSTRKKYEELIISSEGAC